MPTPPAKPRPKAAPKATLGAAPEQALARLQAQIALAQYYVASDGQELNLASLQQKKNAHVWTRYSATEQTRIRGRLATYKRLQGQAGHISRQLNRVRGLDGQLQHVLTAHEAQLLEWFARHYDGREVHRLVLTELGLETVSYGVVRKWQQQNLPAIKAAQAAARADLSDLPLSHKRVRLEELHDLYLEAKQQYEHTHRPLDRDACLRIIEQIRKETDGELLTITGRIDIDATLTLSVEQRMQAELTKQLPLQAIVLAKVAAARGIDPAWLLARLQQSYYARFNGFVSGRDAANGPSDEFVFPSETGYDFNAIEALHRQRQASGEGRPPPLLSPPPASPAQRSQLDEAKRLLLKRLGLG